jgi:hypothetical protein
LKLQSSNYLFPSLLMLWIPSTSWPIGYKSLFSFLADVENLIAASQHQTLRIITSPSVIKSLPFNTHTSASSSSSSWQEEIP